MSSGLIFIAIFVPFSIILIVRHLARGLRGELCDRCGCAWKHCACVAKARKL